MYTVKGRFVFMKTTVVKRDGHVVEFNLYKIISAIEKANNSVDEKYRLTQSAIKAFNLFNSVSAADSNLSIADISALAASFILVAVYADGFAFIVVALSLAVLNVFQDAAV